MQILPKQHQFVKRDLPLSLNKPINIYSTLHWVGSSLLELSDVIGGGVNLIEKLPPASLWLPQCRKFIIALSEVARTSALSTWVYNKMTCIFCPPVFLFWCVLVFNGAAKHKTLDQHILVFPVFQWEAGCIVCKTTHCVWNNTLCVK